MVASFPVNIVENAGLFGLDSAGLEASLAIAPIETMGSLPEKAVTGTVGLIGRGVTAVGTLGFASDAVAVGGVFSDSTTACEGLLPAKVF